MNPLVTLITPVYNAMPYFRNYLASVLSQTWRPLQFIVVDDGSTDGSYEYLMEMKGIFDTAKINLHVRRISHSGQAAAMDAALQNIEGEYLTWCDADDRITPDSLEKKAIWLTAHPEIGMVRSDGVMTAWDQGGLSRRMATTKDRFTQDIFDALFHGTTYCNGGNYMVRSSLMFECYPERHIPLSPEGQNLQLLLPPASRTACGFVPEELFYYDIRNGGHSSLKRSFTRQMERAWNFYRLRDEILSRCECDRAFYKIENRKIYEECRRQILESAVNAAKRMIKNESRNLDIS